MPKTFLNKIKATKTGHIGRYLTALAHHTKRALEEMVAKGLAKDAEKLFLKKEFSGLLSMGKAKIAMRGILRLVPVGVLFLIHDYAEGGTKHAIKNAAVPADLIEQLVGPMARRSQDLYWESIRKQATEIWGKRFTRAGFSPREAEDMTRRWLEGDSFPFGLR